MILLRWITNAVLLLVAATLVAGFEVSSFYSALIAALVLGLINAIIRPLLILLTLPVNIMTLGLFTLVINGLMVWLMSTLVKGITLEGFIPAVMVAIILWLGGWVTSVLMKDSRQH